MGLLQLVAIILIIMWLGGFAFNVAGSFIHILLVVAVVLFLLKFLRRAA